MTRAFARHPGWFDPAAWLPAEAVRRAMQTGWSFLVAEVDGGLAASCRLRATEGSLEVEALASNRAGAGREAVAGAERHAQDQGLRWLRLEGVAEIGVRPLFEGWGYQVVSREVRRAGDSGVLRPWTRLVFEKRLRLLTARPARRGDEAGLLSLGWPDAPAGVTVTVDGERIVGAAKTERRAHGEAALSDFVLAEGYGGRGLEAWMAAVAARTAATSGYVRLYAARARWPERLLASGWREEGDYFVRELGDVAIIE